MDRAAVRVTNRLLIQRASALDRAVRERFEHRNPAAGEPGEPARIRTWRLEGDEYLSLPRGGAERVRSAADEVGVAIAWSDERSEGLPELAGQVPRVHVLPLRAYQREMVAAAVRVQNCLLRAPTGSGKTTVGLALIAELGLPTLVVVPTVALLEQWRKRCGSELGMYPEEVGTFGDGIFEQRGVTLAIDATLRSRKEWVREHAGDFGLVIADEVQRAAAPTIYDACDAWSAKYRVGISADETRRDGLEFLIYDVFGRVACEVQREQLEAEGAVLPVRIILVPTDFRADWYVQKRQRGALKNWDHGRLEKEMCVNAARNALAVRLARAEVERGERVLVWVPQRDVASRVDAELVRQGVLSGLMLGGKASARAFEQTRVGLGEGGNLRAGVGTIEAVGASVDLPLLSRGVLCVPSHNNRQQLNQARGRICRPGTADAAMYYLWDRHVYGNAPIANLLKWYGDDVHVLDGEEVVPARHYRRERAPARDEVPGDDGLEGIFTR